MDDVVLAIGTRKGLFLGRRSGAGTWELTGPHFPMQAVYSVGIDTRRAVPRLLVGADSSHWGPSVFRSDDLGHSWEEPARPAVRFPKDTDASLERVWQIQPAGAGAPDLVWAGTEPGALFRSDDGGVTFEFVRSLWEHPQRELWGAGFGGQAVHTVLTDPRDADVVIAAVSSGGVYRSADGGASWEASNTGIKAEFLPDPYPEFGQCVHKIDRDAEDPDRLYLQNHGGVYRSDDAGASWTEIGKGLPADFGFAIAAHPAAAVSRTSPRSTTAATATSRTTAAGSTAPRTPAPRGRPCPPGCPRRSTTAWSCATGCAPTTRTRSACTSATATARCTPAPTRATPGNWSPRTCPTCCA